MESDFLQDPANAYLFDETTETNVPETNVPETSVPETSVSETNVPETIVRPQKRKQPVTEASSKKRKNDSTQKKKKEPELVCVRHNAFGLL